MRTCTGILALAILAVPRPATAQDGVKWKPCKFYTKMEDKDVLGWEWIIDPELALPLKSVAYVGGQGQIRLELASYKKD